ncbi:hypothetical protein DFH09DRAFT_989507 [Mycena vulgaris]|nr:hypothetical protein DFH09DRAFT_989507 [Mycena vulgaris]
MPPSSVPLYRLSTLSSHLLALLFSSSYVGSLYVVKNARIRFTAGEAQYRVQSGGRDDPAIIRARLSAVTIASVFTCGAVSFLISGSVVPSARTLAVLGLSWPTSILSCLQTPLLFLGPLYASYLGVSLPAQANYFLQRDFTDVFCTWTGFRNYVWGPLTEEIVFRACVLAVYALGGAARWKMIAFAPLLFGLAHVHHAWETYTRYGRTRAALNRALVSTLFQTAYTTLFGAHTSYLFLRTASLLPPLTAHVFCNIMGVPQMGAEVRRFPARKNSIRFVYLLGIALFCGTLAPWTRQESIY